MSYWPLVGVAVVVIGFAARQSPLRVVIAAVVASGLASGMGPRELLALVGRAFVANRALLVFVLVLPVIGVLERAGLRERARASIAGFGRLTLARLLVAYLAARQLLSMLGLTNIAGQAQTVRPLIAPMCEATAGKLRPLDDATRDRVRALAAATDNIGLFFGEDAFLAFGGVLLIQRFYAGEGITLAPFDIAVWALPTAGAAFVIHAVRIWLFQRELRR